MQALESTSPLIVYIDIKSPYAFVAIKPILALEARLQTEFDWRPLTLNIPSYLGSAKKSKGKVVQSERTPAQWNNVRYAYRDTRRYAERQGYMLKGTEKIWDSSTVNIGILWVTQNARDRLAAYLEAVYPPFWRRELDIEDVGVVEAALRTADVPVKGFADFAGGEGEGRAAHDALQEQLHPAGIYGVPSFVFDGQVLFGREHLPYVSWHLDGRKGTAPDMAYEL
jgi:2-hydroxychromene-2-carboxylate isomerase